MAAVDVQHNTFTKRVMLSMAAVDAQHNTLTNGVC